MNVIYDAHDFYTWAAIVLRAPDAAWDGCRYVGSELDYVDETHAKELGLDYQLVRDGQFCAVAAGSREAALQVAAALQLAWRPSVVAKPPIAGSPGGDHAFQRQYRWHAMASPTGRAPLHDAAVYTDPPCRAEWAGDALALVLGAGRNTEIIAEAAAIFGISETKVAVTNIAANTDQAAYDAALDAAIVARVIQRPVHVWPVRESGHDAMLLIKHSADIDAEGRLQAWMTTSGQPEALRPSAAFVAARGGQEALRFGSASAARGARPQEAYFSLHTVGPSISTIRLDSAIDANAQQTADVFAQESFVDEVAREVGHDPIQWRLRQLQDPAGRALIEQVAAAAGWRDGVRGRGARTVDAVVRRGQGFACVQQLDESLDPPQRAWAAWVVDVSVDASGLVNLDNITVGHHLDDLLVANADDPRWGPELANAAQALLRSGSAHDRWLANEDGASASGQSKSTIAGTGVAPRTVSTQAASAQKALAQPAKLSTSAALSLPAAAAVANAIFDATGVRLYEAPFELSLTNPTLSLKTDDMDTREGPIPSNTRRRRRFRGAAGWMLGLAGGVTGAVLAAVPWRPAVPPVKPDLSVYSSEAIDRGRLIAAGSNCVACHTAPGGVKNAGGLAMDTPFGTIYTTNITPDPETGLGSWSFAAFDRAMREGISRDGRFLYPAFPYTSFAKFSDGDMQALYAYLMSEPAVKSQPPETKLAFPYNLRPMMGYWNLLFHKNEPYVYNDEQSTVWNRGAYLVQGPGHCMACHSPRNALGAEKNGPSDFLAGGVVDGWDAPALNGTAPVTAPWTTQDMFQYLRTGFSDRHGVAAGPMAPVITSLQSLPDSDIQAMAVYLSSLGAKPESAQAKDALKTSSQEPRLASPELRVLSLAGQNIYEGACAACHDSGAGVPLFGVRPSMPLNTNITADKPDNLIRIVLEGISQPVDPALGYMPGFADVLQDDQIAELASYLRGKYASQHKPWDNLEQSVQRVRAESERHAASMSGALP
ncbi:c-type cytochrome [Pusillimonas sp.]|uniref:c-type cytochrome n=1 Tax=Pusillimonas sp. TaxID=3040095 RepID=UPI0037C7F263